MPSCFDILNQIISRSSLDRKDGHPLYRYRVTPDELDLLRVELKFHLDTRGSFRMAEDCAAFCLFGAEWFRRNYQCGPWSWDVIFDALGLVGERRPKAQATVAEYVKRGLRYWNVRLLSTQLMNLYLRTLVCQGGFPINTLRNEGAGLSRMLKACLRDHERYPTESMDEILSRLFDDDLRDREGAKIDCGKAHFKALTIGENPACYKLAATVDDLFE